MNEPKKEYGWLTAITPEEIKALGVSKQGDEYWSSKEWRPTGAWMQPAQIYKDWGYGVRRPIDPGESWEKVDGDEYAEAGMEATSDGKTWIPVHNGIAGKVTCGNGFIASKPVICARRRKAKSEPAMDDGWELVPDSEIRKLAGTHQPAEWQWQTTDGSWIAGGNISSLVLYRRPKSKSVEQYGWLKPDCGVEMPQNHPFMVKLENGAQGNVVMGPRNNDFYWQSSSIRIESPIAYWFSMPPAPDMAKVDPCKEAFVKYDISTSDMPNYVDWCHCWQACCDHYHVGDQSKGAK